MNTFDRPMLSLRAGAMLLRESPSSVGERPLRESARFWTEDRRDDKSTKEWA